MTQELAAAASPAAAKTATKPLRVASLGIGWWSDVLADAAKRSGLIEIVSCYTRGEEKRRAFAAKYSCRAAASYEEILPIGWLQLLGSAFFFRNYLTALDPDPWYTGHFWSLAVEEHFYLLWPLLLALFNFRRAPYIAALLAVLVGVWRGLDERYQWVAELNPLLKGDVRRTDYRLDILLWGCVFAFLWKLPWVRCRLRQIGASLLVCVVLLATTACLYWEPPGYLAILAILMAVLPIATVAEPESLASRVLEWKPLSWIGRVSYSIYLWQQLFLPAHGVQRSLGWLQTFPWNLLALFGAAALSYYCVERPSMLLGKKLSRSAAHV